MIISHKHKFIFIKTHKVAGTSLELYLRSILPDTDVFGDIWSSSALLEPGMSNYLPQNCGLGSQHAAASYLQPIFPKEFNNYYSFTIERNPWDKVLSFFFMQKKNGFAGTFDQFLVEKRFRVDKKLYTDENGEIMLDEVLLYENLQPGLSRLFKKLNVPFTRLDIQARGSYRTDRKPYRELYTESQAALVAEAFSWEIKTFRYTF